MSTLLTPYDGAALAVLVLVAAVALLLAGQGQIAQQVGSSYALLVAFNAVGMVRDLLRGHWGVDVLAATAIVSTVAVDEYLAALVIVVMLTGGEALEDYAAGRANRELRALLERAPQQAHRLQPNAGNTGDGAIEDVDVEDVVPGDRLLVRPAEVVPVDAELVSADATFDESTLTGESLPVTRSTGERVLSGSVNGGWAIEVTATARSADSQYQ